jgi:hypothetical protein
MDLKIMVWESVDSIDLAQVKEKRRAVLNAVMNFRVPYKAGNFFTSCGTIAC